MRVEPAQQNQDVEKVAAGEEAKEKMNKQGMGCCFLMMFIELMLLLIWVIAEVSSTAMVEEVQNNNKQMEIEVDRNNQLTTAMNAVGKQPIEIKDTLKEYLTTKI